MRGRRAKLNENGDGEVDENFWAQAAAGQAAADDDQDGDESKFSGCFPNAHGLTSNHSWRCCPIQHSVLPRRLRRWTRLRRRL